MPPHESRPFTEESVSDIAALLGVPARIEPYQVRGAAVYRLLLRSEVLDREIAVLLWPSLGRVDVHIGDSTMVYRGVTEVEFLPGVEVIFRRGGSDGYLFVSVGGRASMVSPSG